MNAFTGAEGELAVNTTTDTVHVHDGSTAGGFALAKADGSNIAAYAGSFTTLAASGASTLTGAVGINIAPTSYKLTVNSGATTETTAAAIGYNGDAGTNLYINTDHGNNLVSLYASGSASKTMRFLSGSLEVMRLATTGDVGINNSNPSAFNSLGGKTLAVGNGTTTSTLTLFSDDTADGNGYGHVAFADSDTSSSTAQYAGLLQYFHGDNSMRFYTASTERLRITSAGAVELTGPGGAGETFLNFTADSNTTKAQILAAKAGASGGRLIFSTTNSSGTLSERARIDASGILMVATTDTAPGAGDTNTGVSIRGAGDNRSFFSVNGDYAMHLNRNTNDGSILEFAKSGTTVGAIATWDGDLAVGQENVALKFNDGSNEILPWSVASNLNRDNAFNLGSSSSRFKALYLSSSVNIGGVGNISPYGIRFAINGTGSGGAGLYFGSGVILPTNNTPTLSDNTVDLGASNYRFNDAFVTNGVTGGSDGNLKQDIAELTDAEQRVAVACKGLLRKFRWIDAVAEKGDEARIHFGIIAQDLQAAFEAEGLDAGRYAMFMSNTWWETQTEVAAVEATEDSEAVDAYTRTDTYDAAEEAPEGATERTRLGVRYSELLAFIISAI
jgi:hypothetical protein